MAMHTAAYEMVRESNPFLSFLPKKKVRSASATISPAMARYSPRSLMSAGSAQLFSAACPEE